MVSDIRLKRLKKNPNEIIKPYRKFQSVEPSKGLVVGAKKRIKQKSLADIVANNLSKVNQSTNVPRVSILKKPLPTSKKSNKKALAGTVAKDNKPSKKVNFSQKKDEGSRETVVEFVKTTKENAIKTILARKRKNDTGEQKKSLSSIFRAGDTNESKLLRDDVDTGKASSEFTNKKQKSQFEKKCQEKGTVSFDEGSETAEKSKKSRDKAKSSKKGFKESHAGSHSHQSGKMSSLFGNNPEIPNIGQRFVKPVNEKVFSVEKFSELGIHAFSVSNLEQNMKITTMTTVQKKAIPVILSGSDVLIRSQTGSGKTLSYALPIIETLQCIRPKLPRNSGIKALVIVPTRELALQTYECFLKLIKVSFLFEEV